MRKYPFCMERHGYPRQRWLHIWEIVLYFLLLVLVLRQLFTWQDNSSRSETIIVITPTHKRPERLADMTRLAQTLSHIDNLHWIVVEDGKSKIAAVERILLRSGLPYTYFTATTEPGFPKRGWTHRNMALRFIRRHYKDYDGDAVIYFGDDDNSYDTRLFDNYIRNVKKIGFWAVGLAGTGLVEAPHVVNGTIASWDVVYLPGRPFALDMAGFAVNLKLILEYPRAEFGRACTTRTGETCFLEQFNLTKEQCEPFGYEDDPKEILVWHTKTSNMGTKGSRHGYVIE
uniref:Galactosylgalactosylxylosylprotein 3-beta-glucuronosyltransferase n=1 Tax=Steinernema glaseri TaxID=37863 RepID=A0A1I7YCD5_9BILA